MKRHPLSLPGFYLQVQGRCVSAKNDAGPKLQTLAPSPASRHRWGWCVRIRAKKDTIRNYEIHSICLIIVGGPEISKHGGGWDERRKTTIQKIPRHQHGYWFVKVTCSVISNWQYLVNSYDILVTDLWILCDHRVFDWRTVHTRCICISPRSH